MVPEYVGWKQIIGQPLITHPSQNPVQTPESEALMCGLSRCWKWTLDSQCDGKKYISIVSEDTHLKTIVGNMLKQAGENNSCSKLIEIS